MKCSLWCRSRTFSLPTTICGQKVDTTGDNGEILTIFGYDPVRWKTVVSWVGTLLTLGTLQLVFRWSPRIWLYVTHTPASLTTATRILVKDSYKGDWVTYSSVQVQVLPDVDSSFTYKSVRYVMDEVGRYRRLEGIAEGWSQRQVHATGPLTKAQRLSRRLLYGTNEICVPVTPIGVLLLHEVSTPFYAFQVASFLIWLVELYVLYIIILASLTAIGLLLHVYHTRKSQRDLKRRVIAKGTIRVVVQQEGVIVECTTQLVPGDIVILHEGIVYCNAILLSGTCLVDESMLTGEANRILKTSVPCNDNLYHVEDASGHTLFAGTKIVQSTGELRALVTGTGFLSAKGVLIRSIMYPPPVDYAFDRDCSMYCLVMFTISSLLGAYIAIRKAQREIPWWDVVIKMLDSMTILLPAALPVATLMGKLLALRNLRQKDVNCTNSKVLNMAGGIDCVCLDKTGTITESTLTLRGVQVPDTREIIENNFPHRLLLAMSVCHSLVMFEGALQGDPMEVHMFQATGSRILSEHRIQLGDDTSEVTILERYRFSSNLRRMSVIVQTEQNAPVWLVCKGSPETLQTLCSLPTNEEDTLSELTQSGYRVIAVAMRMLEGDLGPLTSRERLERDLTFLGYLIFENRAKEGSRSVIQTIRLGGITVKMLTGDNVETAVAVAKQCDIYPSCATPHIITDVDDPMAAGYQHIAMTGQVWADLATRRRDLMLTILPRTRVFARMTSVQKQEVVEELQAMGHQVCMCGDGTNDCRALKVAHVGISIAESESSVAAPLTTRTGHISVVLDVIREGRSALVTTGSTIRQTLAACIVQYTSVMLLFHIDASLADMQCTYLDLQSLILCFCIAFMKAAPGPLHPSVPTRSMFSVLTVLSLVAHLLPVISFQMLALSLLRSQSWFIPFAYDHEHVNNFVSHETSAIYILVVLQYNCMALVFVKGAPHHRPIFTNYLLVILSLTFLAMGLTITLAHLDWLSTLFALHDLPIDFRCILLALGAAHFLCTLFLEEVIVDRLVRRWRQRTEDRKCQLKVK